MISAVGVVVPARNERAHIGSCISALTLARDRAVDVFAIPIRIVVVLDSCTDDTVKEIDANLRVVTVSCRHRSVGAARALGVQTVMNDLGHRPESTWLANTDADSRVPLDWLTHMIELGNSGTHIALGTIRPDLAADRPAYRRWHRDYIPLDGHPHIHGANLGIRADTYLDLGGWPCLTHDEDVELVRRANMTAGLQVVRTAAIPIITSARHNGRAPAGFARYMADLHIRRPGAESPPTPGMPRGHVSPAAPVDQAEDTNDL